MKEVIAALLVALSLCSGNAEAEDMTGYIFLGDSRTVGMDMAIDIEGDSSFVVANAGEGYKWMVDEGLPEVCDIIEEHPEFGDWVLITNLGVNDLHNVNKYVDAYEELSDLLDVYVVSVNPCKGDYSNLNSKINSFNNKMSNLDCVTYVDTATVLIEYGFGSQDGLHYDNDTYGVIYDRIIDAVEVYGRSD